MSSTMPPDRVEQFKSDVAAMKLKTGSTSRDRLFQTLGAVLLVAGIAVAVASYVASTHQEDARDQNELVTLALAAVCMTLTGVALFLRYSLARFLRFWLLRQMYEDQAHIDQIVDAIDRR